MLLGEHKLDLIQGLLLGLLNSFRIRILDFVERHEVVLLHCVLLVDALLHVLLNLLHSSQILHLNFEVELTIIETWNEFTKSLSKLF